MTSRVVFVGNIPYDVAETQLIDIFKEVGPVVSFRLVFDRDSGKPKGFGFCTFKDADTAASANYDVGGRQLRIAFAESDKEDQAPPGRDDEPKAPFQQRPPPTQPMTSQASTEAVHKVLDSIPSAQLVEVMAQMKFLVQNNPDQARALLNGNPQLAYAIFQTMLAMNVVDPMLMQRIAQGNAPPPQQPNFLINPAPANPPSQFVPQAPQLGQQINTFVQEQQKQLLLSVLKLSPEEIQLLPPDQRAQILELRAQLIGSQ